MPDPRPEGRDPRLDALRGLALLTIFVDHLPGTPFEQVTLRHWGFSDAAEAFFLMSGVAAGLAYGPAFAPGGSALAGTLRAWGRAWTLYLVHLLITVAALGVAAGLALLGLPGLLDRNKVDALLDQPLQALLGLPLLLFQIDYADILPIYAVLLLVAPGLLWVAWRAPGALLAGSVALWLIAGELRLNLPTWPVAHGWFLSPFSWQVLFVLGLLTGVRARQGRRLVRVRLSLVWACGAFLVLALLWRVLPAVSGSMNPLLGRLDAAGVPWTLVAFHKTWETAPRLIHALALAYVLSALPLVRRVCAARWAAPLRLVGRHALPVFALGSILAFLLQGITSATGPDPALEAALLGGGLLLQVALAAARDWARGVAKAASARARPVP